MPKMSAAVRDLTSAFRQALGNKLYMREIDFIFSKLDLTEAEQHSLYYLIRDLKHLKHSKDAAERKSRRGF